MTLMCCARIVSLRANYTIYFFRTSVYIADTCYVHRTNAVCLCAHVYTCNNYIIWCMWIYSGLQDWHVHLQVCVTGESERTPLVILTMSRLTILEDSWQVHAINHRFVRFLHPRFFIAELLLQRAFW